MHKKLRLIITTCLIAFASCITINAYATEPPPPGGGSAPAPPCWPPPCTIPIDGGISFLITAGVVYGGKKLYRKKASLDL